MKKKLLLITTMLCLCLLAACGKAETIDGKWELTKKKLADGTVLKGDDVESYECYEINGSTASYTCIAEPIGETSFDLQVEQISDNEYSFKITDTLVFVTGKLKGKTLSYTFGEDEDAVEFIFEKK